MATTTREELRSDLSLRAHSCLNGTSMSEGFLTIRRLMDANAHQEVHTSVLGTPTHSRTLATSLSHSMG